MQSGEDQVTGHGRLDRDFTGFQVTNLADHTDVGVLAEEGLEGLGKGHARFFDDVTWLMPAKLNSTGSSAVRIFTSSVLRRVREE